MALSSLPRTAVCNAWPASSGVLKVACAVSAVVPACFFEQPRTETAANMTSIADIRKPRVVESFDCNFIFLPSLLNFLLNVAL